MRSCYGLIMEYCNGLNWLEEVFLLLKFVKSILIMGDNGWNFFGCFDWVFWEKNGEGGWLRLVMVGDGWSLFVVVI